MYSYYRLLMHCKQCGGMVCITYSIDHPNAPFRNWQTKIPFCCSAGVIVDHVERCEAELEVTP